MVKWVGMGLSAAMFAFSAWIYTQTGDWVALLFMALSAGYGVLFASGQLSRFKNDRHSDQ